MIRLTRRVAGLLVNPSREWQLIAGERADIPRLYASYIAILAAIPAVSLLTGIAVSGGRYLGAAAIATAITAAVVSYATALAQPWALGIVLSMAAGRFRSAAGMDEAVRLAGYAATPYWLAGVGHVFVGTAPLIVAGGLYAVYLFFLGLTPVMEVPADQRVPFTLVAVISALVISVVFTWALGVAGLPHFAY